MSMKKILYVHGMGGFAAEAEQYENILGREVIGLDYNDYRPWIMKEVIHEKYRELKKPSAEIEVIANSIGEDLLKVVIDFARDGKLPDAIDSVPSGTVPSDSVAGEGTAAVNSQLSTLNSQLTEPTLTRLVHRLRKVMVALLVGRTSVLKYAKEQKVQAHDDGVRMLQNVTEYLKSLVPPEPAPQPSDVSHQTSAVCPPPSCPVLGGSAADNAALWTAPLL